MFEKQALSWPRIIPQPESSLDVPAGADCP